MTEVPQAGTAPRQTHPITPVVHIGKVLPLAALAAVGVLGNLTDQLGAGGAALAMLGILVLITVATLGYQYLAWQRLRYWFDDSGDLRVASGVLTRTERRLQLSRLQAVDITQPLLARLFGLAEVSVEVAGSGDSRAHIQFVTLADASALRNQIVARSAGLHPDAGQAPEQPLAAVPSRDLLISLLLRGSTVVAALLTVFVVVTTIVTSGAGGALLLLTGGLPLVIVAVEFTRHYNFTVGTSPDGLRLRAGLLRVTSQTIPPGRVQALEFEQPFLWRRRDWVRVKLNVAGLRQEEDSSGNSIDTVLLPVAPYEVALRVVGQILPGVDARSVTLAPAPPAARRRAWIQYSFLGVGWDEQVFVTRRGRFVRRLTVVPHERSQSVRVTQGPWQRALGLASMHVDSPPGPVRIDALYRGAGEARALADAQHRRAQDALAGRHTTRWMAPE